MDSQLLIDSEPAVRLAAELSALTGESLADSIVAALTERLERERTVRQREAGRSLARAIAMNVRQESRHLACVPDHGWFQMGNPLPH